MMLYIFEVANGPLDEAALLVPIEAPDADSAWGLYYRQQGTKWANVRLQDVGGADRVLPGIKRVMNRGE
jgi:hypothetical protein